MDLSVKVRPEGKDTFSPGARPRVAASKQKLAKVANTIEKIRPHKTPRGAMPLTKLLAVVASLASAVIVRDATEFQAELASGAPSIELL